MTEPRKRDPIQTQDRILAAALAEFARRGFDGARVEAIAKRAKTSKNLLYHYFGSKEDLYVKALEQTYETLRRHQNSVQLAGLGPVEAMERLCESTFQVFIDVPEIIVMLNTENLHRGKHIAKSPIIRALYDRLSDSIRTILSDGEKAGVFRSGVDAVDLYISISALGYFYLSNRYTLSLLFARELGSADNLARRKAHIVDLVLSFLTSKRDLQHLAVPVAPLKEAPPRRSRAPA